MPNPWKPMQSAPRDGTLVDLMYPHPRGRTINASWNAMLGWHWKEPRWENMELLPEEEWPSHTYPNMQPLAWMPCPPRPEI